LDIRRKCERISSCSHWFGFNDHPPPTREKALGENYTRNYRNKTKCVRAGVPQPKEGIVKRTDYRTFVENRNKIREKSANLAIMIGKAVLNFTAGCD
jgi:hypothetical protein